jgi:tRNA threonylcarbamoyl adenosine modification protein YeaZ
VRLLAWDTSSKVGALAALEWDARARAGQENLRVVSEWTLNVAATHSERLLWAVDGLLEAAGWRLADVDVFGVGVGPGSFTGLRIGITTARTLAHEQKKPLVGVSSLAALARPAAAWLGRAEGKGRPRRAVVIAATDAAKGELFALWGSARSVADCSAHADGDRAGAWKRGVEEQVLAPAQLQAAVKRKLAEGGGAQAWAVVGEARERYPEIWAKLPAARRVQVPAFMPDHVQGRYVGLLAWEAYQAGLARPALEIHPRYLRVADAELKLKAGLLPPGPTRGDRE